MILICIFLKDDDVEHLFMSLLATCISSLKICLFKSFAHLKTGLFALLLNLRVLYIFWGQEHIYDLQLSSILWNKEYAP